MPEYLSPGVYVEEVPSGPRPIEGVSTSTAGFVGQTERGPTRPRLVTNIGDYGRWFGGTINSGISYLPFAVRGFFDNGGQRLFVARVTRAGAAEARQNFATTEPAQSLTITANGPGQWGSRIFLRISDSTGRRRTNPDDPTQTAPIGFRITLLYYGEPAPPVPLVDPLDPANVRNPNRVEPDLVEDYDDLGFDPNGGNYVVTRINASSSLVEVTWSARPPAEATARPNNTPGFVQLSTATDLDGTADIGAADYTGNPDPDPLPPPDQRRGLAGLELIDEVALLSVPDHVHSSLATAEQNVLTNAIVDQCELLRERFALLNIEQGQGAVQTILPPRDSSYAAVFWPWIRVFDSRLRETLLVPPSGHMAGIYARSDVERGVYKAPANEVVRGMITTEINATRRPLEYHIGKREHDILNPNNVNVIRDFRADGRGIRLWGARTSSSDPLWRYVNVRRLFLYVEESIDEGTQWVVFEPNDEPLWAQVRQTVRNFLLLVWRSGALQGQREEDAFFVRCDRTTMTQADIDAGRLICLIGIAPVKPAEFVIFRIMQRTLAAAA